MSSGVKRPVKIVLALVVLVGLGFGGFAVFEHFDHEGKVKDAQRACGSTYTTPVPGVALPSGLDFTVPEGQTLWKVESQGKTDIVYTFTPGSRDDLVKLRDQVVDQLKSQGFTAAATDQEPTYEAEGTFSGKAKGTIQVQGQCEGYDRVRYKFNR